MLFLGDIVPEPNSYSNNYCSFNPNLEKLRFLNEQQSQKMTNLDKRGGGASYSKRTPLVEWLPKMSQLILFSSLHLLLSWTQSINCHRLNRSQPKCLSSHQQENPASSSG